MIRERKIIFVLLFFTLLFVSINVYAENKLKCGIKCGINFSSYIAPNNSEHYLSVGSAGSRCSPTVIYAASVSFRFNKFPTLQTEILNVRRKYNVKYENLVHGSGDYYSQSSTWDGFQEITYLEFSFIVKTMLLVSGKEVCKPYIGMYQANLLERKYKYDFAYVAKNSEGEVTESYEKTIKDQLADVKEIDNGFILGSEFSLSKILKPLFLDVRLTMSMDKINENTLPGSVKNFSVICFLGITYWGI